MTNEDAVTRTHVLHSWKEIASYTGRGVRTIQRYESQLGFPVRRPAGTSRSAVLAFSHEIDAWLAKSPMRLEAPPATQAAKGSSYDQYFDVTSVYKKAKAQAERAQAMSRRMQQMEALIEKLKASMQENRACRLQMRASSLSVKLSGKILHERFGHTRARAAESSQA